MPIQNKGLRNLAVELAQLRQSNPNAQAGADVLAKIASLVGQRPGVSAAQLNQSLQDTALSPQQKLTLVKQGLSAGETSDLKTMLADPKVSSALQPSAANFLKALVGVEPLAAVDAFVVVTPRGVNATAAPSTVAAVTRMRELVANKQLKKYYEAAIGMNGNDALKDEALKLFADLPKLTGATSADDFVAFGLWTRKPSGIEAMQSSARFLPGRQVLVETTVHSDVFDDRTLLSYKEGGERARTYRATLVGESGGKFLVKVDGRDEPILVPKRKLYALNQPHLFSGDKIRLSKQIDYDSPFMKAKLAEAAIKMDKMVGQLDFTKVSTGSSGLLGVLSRETKMSELQRKCVRVVHDVIDMKYPEGSVYKEPGRYSGPDAGRQAVRGIGMCYDQASVMAGLVNPFSSALGVDIQFISGGYYRNVRPWNNVHPFRDGAHGWLQLVYRPSMELRICDRTWQQPDQPADKAYSRWGDRYPGEFYSGMKQAPVKDTDVDVSGKVTVATFERQFGVQGQDGRDNHMSRNQ